MESSFVNAIKEIHDVIDEEGHEFDDLRPTIKRHMLDMINKLNSGKLVEANLSISKLIIQNGFNGRRLSSGNFANDSVKDLSLKYGFSTNSKHNGNCLKEIKRKRNDLAHGQLSFIECSKEYTYQDLQKYKDDTFDYIEAILGHISTYIKEKQFLQPK